MERPKGQSRGSRRQAGREGGAKDAGWIPRHESASSVLGALGRCGEAVQVWRVPLMLLLQLIAPKSLSAPAWSLRFAARLLLLWKLGGLVCDQGKSDRTSPDGTRQLCCTTSILRTDEQYLDVHFLHRRTYSYSPNNTLTFGPEFSPSGLPIHHQNCPLFAELLVIYLLVAITLLVYRTLQLNSNLSPGLPCYLPTFSTTSATSIQTSPSNNNCFETTCLPLSCNNHNTQTSP